MSHVATEIETLAEKLALTARDMWAAIDRERRLPPELVSRLNEAGLLRATMPREVDALELSPATSLRCAEALARGDAATGWCVSIAVTSALLVAYLPEGARNEMFGGGKGVAAGVWAPRGVAKSVDGGVLVSGRWPFCSGITHADLMFAGCFVDGGSIPSVVTLQKDDLQVLDNWHTLGLRGTGSHDTVAKDVFVPADRVFSIFDGPSVDRPLYRFPVFGFFALSVAAAALGNARAAIDDLVELAGGKKGLGATRTLAQRSATAAAVATAESALEAARALYYEAIEQAWQASHEPGPVPVTLRNRLRLAATHAARTSADVVRAMYDLAGGTAIYDTSPLQRRFRDAFTATAHFQVNEASRELPGRLLLDQPADTAML
ncbi:hydroxylase [Mycobacterium asiaticum]|uniref:Hydroxylase n=1 Tax=Mycobacterium asiaticum TaxID=1790 RepID=A0A1A3P8Z3_MYCAS|nr:acyl-CoA dehydrogenase family protein [Mycobacterium asiaticum]OBK30698.1 hydroxylase [Mycobacterium asiaticum]